MAQDESTYGFKKQDASELVQLIGSADTEYPEGRVRGGGNNSNTRIFQTPGGGIAARTGTTVSSATCTEFKIASGSLTTNTTTQTVYNIWPVAIPASYYIKATKESASGQWIAEFPGVVNVRWVDPILEQTWDGSNYSTIDTAVDCV